MKEKILKAINKNSKLSAEDLGKMLGISEEEVKRIIRELEDEKVICGYPTLINWEKVENEEKVRAIIAEVITQYANGEIDYTKAEFNARVKIYQSVNPAFNPDEEFAKDTCYRDIPSVDNSLFTIARKLILESKR